MKKISLKTRPFQHLFAAMEDLRHLATPLHEQIQSLPDTDISQHRADVWRREKSLSLGSLVSGMAGLEGFVYALYEEVAARKPEDLPAEWFESKKKRKERLGRDFKLWPLRERVYFIVSLCHKNMRAPSDFFDIKSPDWGKFVELIAVRNDFVHPKTPEIKLSITRRSDGLQLANDSDKNNFYEATGICRDLRSFNLKEAKIAGEIIAWVRYSITSWLRERLPDGFMDTETWTIDEE